MKCEKLGSHMISDQSLLLSAIILNDIIDLAYLHMINVLTCKEDVLIVLKEEVVVVTPQRRVIVMFVMNLQQ